jgi:hypothetical protein
MEAERSPNPRRSTENTDLDIDGREIITRIGKSESETETFRYL